MEYGVIKQVNQLDSQRFFPMICCLRWRADATRSLLDDRIPVFELHKKSGKSPRVVLQLADLMRRESVDIVHSHNWSTFLFAVAAAALARVPTTIHGEHGRDVKGLERRRVLFSRLLALGVTRLVTATEHLSRELVREWKVRPEKIAVIPNGVDLDAFAPRFDRGIDGGGLAESPFEPAPDDLIVMSVGGLRPIKDQPTLLRAFARLRQALPAAKLILVGSDHGTGIQATLEQLAAELGLGDAVWFTGERRDIPRLLRLCDLYVNTSLFEGMSNTILEAMAAGKPVLATAVGGNPELVTDGVTGCTVPPGDVAALTERMQRLLSDPELRGRLGRAGRERVEANHGMSTMVRAYSDLYEEVFLRARLRRARSGREKLKQAIARGLRWSSLSRLRELAGPDRLTILTYHRVLPLRASLEYPFQGMVMPRDLFEAQMAHLASKHNVVPLADAIRLLAQDRLPGRAVSITFDDGYRDNFDHALPVLRKYGISATFFLVTRAIDGKIRLWWDAVADHVEQLSRSSRLSDRRRLDLPPWMSTLIGELNAGKSHQQVTRELVDRLNGLSRKERTEANHALSACAEAEEEKGSDLMLDWDRVRRMIDAGMHVGAHTLNHAFLDELEEGEIRQEITGSVAALQQETGVTVRLFSFPRGRSGKSAKRIVHQLGLEAAVTTEPGSNKRGADPFQIKRVDAGYCRHDGGFDRALFETEFRGWFDSLRRV